MTLEDALDMVLTEAGRSICMDDVRAETIGKALEMVEDAVLKYIKIENAFDKLQENDQLNGKASIVVEDDSVRAES